MCPPRNSATSKRAGTGVREAKKDALRLSIEKAALKLFSEKGFEQTTVEEIAVKAQVAERTFYRYFPTKEDAVFWRSQDRVAWLRDTLRELDDETPSMRELDWLMKALTSYAAHLDADGELSRLRALIIRSSPDLNARAHRIYAEWGELFAKEISRRRGARTPDLSARIAASIAVSIVGAAFREWGKKGGTYSFSTCMMQVIDAFGAVTDPLEVSPVSLTTNR